MRTSLAVYLGIIYSYLPFMVLPLFATLEKLDHTLLEAAADLGSPPWRAFLDITLPLSIPGVIAGSMLVFIPAVGEFVIPSLLGGPDNLMIGRVLWDEFFGNHDWPVASAVAIAFLVLLAGPIAIYQYYTSSSWRPERSWNGATHRVLFAVLCFGIAVLYIPIAGADRLLLQRLAAGQRVGWLLDPLVHGAAAQPPGAAGGAAVPGGGRHVLHASR